MQIRLLTACFFLLLASFLVAQVPQMINYEGVLRRLDGSPNTLQHIGVRFTISEGINPAVVLYIETDTVTTNGFGLFSCYIGGGSPVLGTFSAINWATGNKYLAVEVDSAGITPYTNMGATKLVSVPYALYADSAGKNGYPVHHVGDNYGGGIIFWTDSIGQHGLIADTADLDTGIIWNNGSNLLTNATRNGIGAGRFNTERIIIKQGTGAYASQLCADYQGGNYSDWYLPSVSELTLLYHQQNIVSGFTGNAYWSSSELSSQQATAISFTDGSFTPSAKSVTLPVRAIRAF